MQAGLRFIALTPAFATVIVYAWPGGLLFYFGTAKHYERYCMITDLFSVAMVILIGTLSGTCIGLCLGYLLGLQKPEWTAMPGREKMISILLVLACSAIAIAGMAGYFLIRVPAIP